MTKSSVFALLLAGGLMLPGTLRAQHAQHHPQGQDQPQQGMMGQGMMGQGMMGQGHGMMGMGMMSAPGPRMILMQKDALGLSESQVERLEALREEVNQARQSLMSRDDAAAPTGDASTDGRRAENVRVPVGVGEGRRASREGPGRDGSLLPGGARCAHARAALQSALRRAVDAGHDGQRHDGRWHDG